MPTPIDDRTVAHPGPTPAAVSTVSTADGRPQTGTLVQDAPTMELPPGQPAIPGYRIEQELGRGGMGVVYKATQVGLNRTVAIKMILAGSYATREAVRRFRAEAEVIARLKHPGIVQVYDIGETGGLPYFVLEFVDGGGLDRRLAAGRLPVPDAARLAADLADAVAAAHAAGIVHRDLKPANILLAKKSEIRSSKSERGAAARDDSAPGAVLSDFELRASDSFPKVADFGLAKNMADGGLTATGAVMGTPMYMAPEQAAGRAKEIGPAADVYALGAILYEMLTGEPPFKGESVLSTLDLVRSATPRPVRTCRREVPREVEAVCLKCLEKRPEDRYASAADLAADLRRVAAGERPTGAKRRPGNGRRRAAIAAGVLLALVAAAVPFLRRPTAAVPVPSPPADGPTGGVHALFVAVDEYTLPGRKATWQFADRDVIELARVLNESWGVPKANLRVLTVRHSGGRPEAVPTGANVRAELRRLRDRCSPDAVVLVTLCGSGLQAAAAVPAGVPRLGPSAFHFIPADGDSDRLSTLVSAGELADALDDCPARAKLVLVDACRGVKGYPPGPLLRAAAGRRTAGSRLDAATFYACRVGEQSHEDAVLRHGVFTRGVLAALEDGAEVAADGRLDLGELVRFATDDVARSVERLRLPTQRPELVGGLPADTVLLTKPAGDGDR